MKKHKASKKILAKHAGDKTKTREQLLMDELWQQSCSTTVAHSESDK